MRSESERIPTGTPASSSPYSEGGSPCAYETGFRIGTGRREHRAAGVDDDEGSGVGANENSIATLEDRLRNGNGDQHAEHRERGSRPEIGPEADRPEPDRGPPPPPAPHSEGKREERKRDGETDERRLRSEEIEPH